MSSQPNVIVIITDDQGYGDLSCMGSETVKTPHLDRVAAEGLRCTAWYSSSPVCSPARAGLLSGRYPGHAGVRQILAGHRTATGMPNTVPTIASVLKAQGYATYLSGKWHLGLAEGCRPVDHGFDHSFGFLAGCVDFFSHIFYWGMNKPGPGVNPTHDLWEDGKEVWRCGEYITESITNKAIDYIHDAQEQDKPFFLYLAYNAPHYPMHAPKKYLDRFAHLPWDRQVMAAMISAVDDGVGEIDAELARLGIRDDTIIVFMSDNGPSRESRNWLDGTLDPYYGGQTGGFKGHKFSLFEGGIRVPGIIRWPAGMPGGRVCDEPLCGMDVLPTLCGILGLNQPGLDGSDLSPLLCQQQALPERPIYWEIGKQTAVRQGPWKLVCNGQLVEHAGPIADIWLSNLDTDPGETTNLADQHPDIAQTLHTQATTWRAQLEQRYAAEFTSPALGTTGQPSGAS